MWDLHLLWRHLFLRTQNVRKKTAVRILAAAEPFRLLKNTSDSASILNFLREKDASVPESVLYVSLHPLKYVILEVPGVQHEVNLLELAG